LNTHTAGEGIETHKTHAFLVSEKPTNPTFTTFLLHVGFVVYIAFSCCTLLHVAMLDIRCIAVSFILTEIILHGKESEHSKTGFQHRGNGTGTRCE